MSEQPRLKRLRAAFKNSVVWGVAWGALGTVWAAVMRLTDNIPPFSALLDGIGMGIRIGVVGALAGAVFAVWIGVAYRDKKLSEISPMRFGVGGAVLAAVFVLVWMQGLNLLGGSDMVAWHLIDTDILIATVFGGVTAGGTMLLAQHDEAKHPVTFQELHDRIERESLGAGDPSTIRARQRSGATQR